MYFRFTSMDYYYCLGLGIKYVCENPRRCVDEMNAEPTIKNTTSSNQSLD